MGSEDLGCPLQRTYSLALRTEQTFEPTTSSPDLQLGPANLKRGSANLTSSTNQEFFEPNGEENFTKRGLQIFTFDRRRRLVDLHKKKVRGEASCRVCGENSRSSKLKELRGRLAPIHVL